MNRALACVLVLGLVGCEPEPKVRSYTVAKPAQPAAAAAAPAASPAMPASPALVAQTGAIGAPTFPSAPAGWTAQDPGAMRKGSWKVAAAGGTADLAVTAFPGDVGGRVANINRWRSQLGLPSVTAEALDAIAIAPVGDVQGEVVDIRSADGTKATVAILASKGEVTWFLKLTGDAATVEAARRDLLAFAAATRLP
jgi:hypothetical protein